jgi:nucleotide-binding universal stress UspA family protein
MLRLNTVLFPTDFSEPSTAAFQMACSLARDYSARLVILHVYPPPLDHSEEVARRQPETYEESLWKRLHAIQTSDPKIEVDYRLQEGDAANEILRIAGEVSADMVVMGTHGRSGVGRLVLGSVAENVLRHAAIPVLTVKSGG